jgi:hypothetical protein
MSNRRGLPSPALLLGMRPVWYCGGNSCGGCSAFGRSCRKRSMVNCARGSSSDELADDCVGAGCAPWPPVTLGSASGADGRRAMMRDSIGNSGCTGYIARNKTEQKMTREQSKCGEKGDNSKTARWVCFCFHLTLDIGAVKRSTLFCWCGNDVWDRSRRKRTIGYWVWYGMHRRLRHTARAQRVVLQETGRDSRRAQAMQAHMVVCLRKERPVAYKERSMGEVQGGKENQHVGREQTGYIAHKKNGL